MGLTVYGGGGKPEEEKTVTAGTSVIEVLPSSGKTMKKVNVNPTPTEEKTITAGTSATTVTPTSGKYIKKVTVNPTPSQEKTVTPTAAGFTVNPDTGKLLSKVSVNGDSNLVAENIKNGINIFGILGTLEAANCKMATGTFTTTSWSTKSVTVNHGLGSIPKIFLMYADRVREDTSMAFFLHTPSSWDGLDNFCLYDKNYLSSVIGTEDWLVRHPTYSATSSSVTISDGQYFDDSTWTWVAFSY